MTPDEKWLEILKSAHDEPIDAAHYTAVRARVMAELAAPRPRWGWWLWVASGVCAAVLALVLWMRPLGRVELPELRAVVLAIPRAPEVPVWKTEPRVAAVRPAAAARHRREPLTIKLQTADPNVVIYWIAD